MNPLWLHRDRVHAVRDVPLGASAPQLVTLFPAGESDSAGKVRQSWGVTRKRRRVGMPQLDSAALTRRPSRRPRPRADLPTLQLRVGRRAAVADHAVVRAGHAVIHDAAPPRHHHRARRSRIGGLAVGQRAVGQRGDVLATSAHPTFRDDLLRADARRCRESPCWIGVHGRVRELDSRSGPRSPAGISDLASGRGLRWAQSWGRTSRRRVLHSSVPVRSQEPPRSNLHHAMRHHQFRWCNWQRHLPTCHNRRLGSDRWQRPRPPCHRRRGSDPVCCSRWWSWTWAGSSFRRA